MLVRIFTLRFNSLLDGFDDTPVRDFIKDKEVRSIREHFFIRDNQPYLTLVICYDLPRMEEPSPPTGTKPEPKRQDESWREILTEADLPLFNALRDWRNERCKQEGIPPYVIVTNRQLAEIVKLRPTTLAKLGEVEGVGKAKLERYGKDLVAILSRHPKVAPPVTGTISGTVPPTGEDVLSSEPALPTLPEDTSGGGSHESPE